jgi:hypothetical protein
MRYIFMYAGNQDIKRYYNGHSLEDLKISHVLGIDGKTLLLVYYTLTEHTNRPIPKHGQLTVASSAVVSSSTTQPGQNSTPSP